MTEDLQQVQGSAIPAIDDTIMQGFPDNPFVVSINDAFWAEYEKLELDESTIRQYVAGLSPLMKSLEDKAIELQKKKVQLTYKIEKIHFCLVNNRPIKCLPKEPPTFALDHPTIATQANNEMKQQWYQYVINQAGIIMKYLKEMKTEVEKQIAELQTPMRQEIHRCIDQHYKQLQPDQVRVLYNAYKASVVLKAINTEAHYKNRFEEFKKFQAKKVVTAKLPGTIYKPEEKLRFKKWHQVPYLIPKKESFPSTSRKEEHRGHQTGYQYSGRNQDSRRPPNDQERRNHPMQREDSRKQLVRGREPQAASTSSQKHQNKSIIFLPKKYRQKY